MTAYYHCAQESGSDSLDHARTGGIQSASTINLHHVASGWPHVASKVNASSSQGSSPYLLRRCLNHFGPVWLAPGPPVPTETKRRFDWSPRQCHMFFCPPLDSQQRGSNVAEGGSGWSSPSGILKESKFHHDLYIITLSSGIMIWV